jgi:hypothetical protein
MSDVVIKASESGSDVLIRTGDGPAGPAGAAGAAGTLDAASSFVQIDADGVWWKWTTSTDGWLQSAVATEEELAEFGITLGGLI